MDAPVNAPSHGDPDSPPAILVVVNGRQSGTRRPLTGPLTLIGRAPDCEVRLNVKGVQPQHAALVQGTDGYHLRNLAGQGVLVNGQPATTCPLDHGDVIGVGPFQFRLERTGPSAKQIAEAERDAVRVQAAAVAAQQAALHEEEMRLRQRRGALEKQEEQLAGHLEARRRRLREIHEQMRREREAFHVGRASAAQEQAALRKEAQDERDAALVLNRQVQERRTRLMQLRRRLRQREQRYWREREAVLARREQELGACEGRLGREAEKLRRERESLTEARLRFNGDAELGKRQLQEQWEELGLAQQQWEACLNEEHAEREKRVHGLELRAAAVDEAERDWAGRERSLRLALAGLHRERTSLETRIANQRHKLAQQETAAARRRAERQMKTTSAAPAAAASPASTATDPPDVSSRALVLQNVAGSLADQRVHLLEQWQTLLRVQEAWRREREQTLAEMEMAGRSLQEWEQWLQMREQDLDAAATECRQRQKALAQARHALEGWQSRLRMREAGWETERAGLMAQARAREVAAARVMKRLQETARRFHTQRGQEMGELAAARKGCDELRQQYVGLWEECQRRRKELSHEQRALAARALAVEQMRSELAGNGSDAAQVRGRIERLERRNVARLAEAEQEIEATRGSLREGIARLQDLGRRAQQQQEELAARRGELARERDAWEEQRAAAAEEDERRRREVELLGTRHDRDARLIAQLRDEVERTVRLLIDDHTDAAPAVQAA